MFENPPEITEPVLQIGAFAAIDPDPEITTPVKFGLDVPAKVSECHTPAVS